MNETLKMLEDYLVQEGALQPSIPYIVDKTISVITGDIPYKLKLSIALSELITVTSHLRKNIKLSDGTEVPCNAITFSLARSGLAKDSSMNMVRSALEPAYNILGKKRKDIAVTKAKKRAILEGKEESEWQQFYESPRELTAGLGTVEGLVNNFADIEEGKIGSAFISSSEIGTELLTNGSITDIIKTISVGYDLGKIPAKIIKSAENQTPSISKLPINALFFGSEDAILEDNTLKAKFKTMFGVQLARRTIFAFTPEKAPKIPFNTPQEIAAYRKVMRESSIVAREEVRTLITDIIKATTQHPITLDEEAQELFDIYLEYNSYLSDELETMYPLTKLSRKHKQWLALKLSGNYAILNQETTISKERYIEAINTIELLSEDLRKFEIELVKEPYEIFVDFMRHNAVNGKHKVGLHSLRKLGYIPTSGNVDTKMKELVHLASSYDKQGIYTNCPEGICFEEVIEADSTGVSYIEVSGSKPQRAKQCASGFEFYETDFEELGGLLQGDYAYSNFRFKDGVRGKDNVINGCSWLVLDIDDSAITDEECHLMLEGLNHHIARTSNVSNAFKFRVLIELDSIVDIPNIQWPYFVQDVASNLGLKCDKLPKAQIYFAYEDREVLSCLDGEKLNPKEFIMSSADKVSGKAESTPKKLSKPQQQAQLDNKMVTFGYAFEAQDGTKSRSLIRAAYHARDLGADIGYIEGLVKEIADYYDPPMPEDRLENTILTQIRRW